MIPIKGLFCTLKISSIIPIFLLISLIVKPAVFVEVSAVSSSNIYEPLPIETEETRNVTEWDPESDNYFNVPITECDKPSQKEYAALKYVEMIPPCEETSKIGFCGVRRFQNITLISKFITKQDNQQLKVRVHLVDKWFGFETPVWPEFSSCTPFFNITCPQEKGLVNSYIYTEMPREIPPLSAIVRVRLIAMNAKKEKTVAICRQINLHVM